MIEVFRNKKVTTLAVVLFGGGLAVGCGNNVEGIGHVNMVRCAPHGSPRYNSASFYDVPNGEQIQMGNKIATNGDGNYPATGDFAVTSRGNGEFKVSINNDNAGNNSADIVPNYTDQSYTVTIADNGELYTVSGSEGPEGSTALSITAKCI